jgi:arylsulfatase A-like enzyme
MPDAARAASRPNILFVFSDQHRGDWQVHRGARFMHTPHLSQLASEGIVFDGAICASPLCVPSRLCLATGRDYGKAPSPDRPLVDNGDWLDPGVPNFYQALRAAGYWVAACGKSDLRKPCRSWGLDGRHRVDGRSEWEALGFTHGLDSAGKHDAIRAFGDGLAEPYFDFLARHGLAEVHADDFSRRPYPNYRNCEPTPLPDFAYGDNFVGARAMELMAEMNGETPWFLQVNFMGPHEPMDITAAMQRLVADREVPIEGADPRHDEGTHRAIRRNYLAMIENIDRWVGVFRATLAGLGALGNTVIVYASDHGEMLGEHEEWAKWLPYRPSIGVPLTIWGATLSHHVDSAPASLIDLGPTFLELAGAPPLAGIEGQSLKARFTGPPDAGTVRLAGLGCWRAVVAERHTLIVGYRQGMSHAEMVERPWSGACETPLLFDRVADPCETTNLAARRPDLVDSLFAHLAASMQASPRRAPG